MQFCEVHFPEYFAYGISHSFDMLFTFNSSIISQFIDWLVMFIFCLCDVVYWISVKIRVNTVQKVKRKNMLPKYVGSFTAEVRTAFLCHRFEVSSPFRGILRCSSEAINSALDFLRRSQICKYPSN